MQCTIGPRGRHRLWAGLCALLASAMLHAADAVDAPPPPATGKAAAFSALGGPTLSEESGTATQLLMDGQVEAARDAFDAAVKANPQDGAALFGRAQVALLEGRMQAALEDCAAAFQQGRSGPWAEVYLDAGADLLRIATDPKPFLDALAAVEADAKLSPYLRDRARHYRADWIQHTGKLDEARAAYAPLQYIDRWALIGPFDNRDKAGFDAEYEPEVEVDFEKSAPGRNRQVSWFHPQAQPFNGRITLSELFEPNIHAIAFGVTHIKVDKAQWAVMRVGCAGAIKVWLNEREVVRVDDYNEYAPEKAAAPVYLQAGWNQLLVKSAVVEETGWAFGVRFSLPEGGPVPGLVADPSAETLAAYLKEGLGRATPLLEPRNPDLGIAPRMRLALKDHPDDAWTRAWYGFQVQTRKLGNKEDAIASKEYATAFKQYPKCPTFGMLLAEHPADVNQGRIAAEQVAAAHPKLVQPLVQLGEVAWQAGLEQRTEHYARQALKLGGVERGGRAVWQMASVLNGKGYDAEAYRMIMAYVTRHPYDPAGWGTRLSLEATRSGYRAALKEALSFCGGNEWLRFRWSNDLIDRELAAEAAAYLETGLAQNPYSMSSYVHTAEAWRRAGQSDKAQAVLARARATAPENVEVLIALGNQELYAGKPQGTGKLWREALRIKPNSPRIKDWLREIDAGGGIDRGFFADYDVALKDLPPANEADFPTDNVVTLLDQEVVFVNPNGTSNRMIHKVVKLLRPDGLNKMRDHSVYYDPQRQQVDFLKASVITPDGRELSRADISDHTVSAAMGVQTRIYDEHHLKQVRFKDLEPGSLVDLQYVIRDSGDNIYGDYFADAFYMGDDAPTLRSEMILDLPKSREFQTQAFRKHVVPERLDSKNPEREVFKWAAKDLAGIEKEPRMPPVLDQIPFIQTTTMKTWQEVSTWYWNLARDSLGVNEDMKAKVAQLIKGKATDTEKLRAIHDWVIKKIRYLGIEFGRNGYKPHRATDSYKALYGDCKDTSALIVAMLKEAGIEGRLVLVRTIDAGKVEKDSLPAPNLFNHCIAYVPDVDGKEYWIDCTTDYHQLGEVPYMDQGAQVLVVGPDGGKFVSIPRDTPEDNRFEVRLNVNVEADGSAKVFARNVYRGQFSPYYRQRADTPGQFKQEIQNRSAQQYPGCTLERFAHAKPGAEGDMWMEAELKVPKLFTKSGDRLALTAIYDRLDLARKYVSGEERKHDLELWFPWARTYEITFHLDPSYTVVALPEEAELKTAYATYARTVKAEGQTVTIKEDFVLTSHRILKEGYAEFNPFCRKVDALMEQKILLKKK